MVQQQLTSKQIRKRQRPDLLHQPNPALVAKPQPQRITRSIGETISRTAIIPIAQEGQAKLITPSDNPYIFLKEHYMTELIALKQELLARIPNDPQ